MTTAERQAIPASRFTRRIGEVIHNSGGPSAMMPVTFVLDDDIDPSNEADLLWALATRLHPRDRRYSWDSVVLPFMACFSENERKAKEEEERKAAREFAFLKRLEQKAATQAALQKDTKRARPVQVGFTRKLHCGKPARRESAHKILFPGIDRTVDQPGGRSTAPSPTNIIPTTF